MKRYTRKGLVIEHGPDPDHGISIARMPCNFGSTSSQLVDPKLIFGLGKTSFIAESFAAFSVCRFSLLGMLFIIPGPRIVESYSFRQSQAMVSDASLLFDKLKRMTSKITTSYTRRVMTYIVRSSFQGEDKWQ